MTNKDPKPAFPPDWRSMNHILPPEMEHWLKLICSAGDAKNELILVGRYQKICRAIYDEHLATLAEKDAQLAEAVEALEKISLGKLQEDIGLPDSAIAWRMMRMAQQTIAKLKPLAGKEGE
jgi:hypothetical protein